MNETEWKVEELGPDWWRISLYKPGVPNRGNELSIEGMTTEEMKKLLEAINEQF